MTEFNFGGRKRKTGGGDEEGVPKKLKFTIDDMDQIESLVVDVVQQVFGENSEEVQELSPGFSGFSQQDFEAFIWTMGRTSSLPQSFPGSQELSLPSTPTSFEFGLEQVEESPREQGFGDEDVVMVIQSAEEDNYVETPPQLVEQPVVQLVEQPVEVEEVPTAETDEDLDDVLGYIKRKALEIFNQAWAELLNHVADEQEIDGSILEIETVRDYDQAKAQCLSQIEEHITELVLSND